MTASVGYHGSSSSQLASVRPDVQGWRMGAIRRNNPSLSTPYTISTHHLGVWAVPRFPRCLVAATGEPGRSMCTLGASCDLRGHDIPNTPEWGPHSMCL